MIGTMTNSALTASTADRVVLDGWAAALAAAAK